MLAAHEKLLEAEQAIQALFGNLRGIFYSLICGPSGINHFIFPFSSLKFVVFNAQIKL